MTFQPPESLMASMLIEDEKKKLKLLEHNARARIVSLTNDLLSMCGSSERVESVRDISSAILIFIFERICHTTLIGKQQLILALERCWWCMPFLRF